MSVAGEFHLDVGWFQDGWSSLSSADRLVFQSDRVRIEARFDGVSIGLVKWPLEIVTDTGIKAYSFQFPNWLTGIHVLEVISIDESASPSFEHRVVATLASGGGGFPASAGSLLQASEGSSARPGRQLILVGRSHDS
jgi:hypothetical protein